MTEEETKIFEEIIRDLRKRIEIEIHHSINSETHFLNVIHHIKHNLLDIINALEYCKESKNKQKKVMAINSALAEVKGIYQYTRELLNTPELNSQININDIIKEIMDIYIPSLLSKFKNLKIQSYLSDEIPTIKIRYTYIKQIIFEMFFIMDNIFSIQNYSSNEISIRTKLNSRNAIECIEIILSFNINYNLGQIAKKIINKNVTEMNAIEMSIYSLNQIVRDHLGVIVKYNSSQENHIEIKISFPFQRFM